MLNIYEQLVDKTITHSNSYRQRLARASAAYSQAACDVEMRCREDELDTYQVNHNLNPQDFRVLCKILAKEYPDCGRKRGAILRYIKYYREQETKKQSKAVPTKRLFKLLKNKSSL